VPRHIAALSTLGERPHCFEARQLTSWECLYSRAGRKARKTAGQRHRGRYKTPVDGLLPPPHPRFPHALFLQFLYV
jgi:hypothetical protein